MQEIIILKYPISVLGFELRAGRSHPNLHMHTALGTGPTRKCPCDMRQMTTDRVLQTCVTCYALAWRRLWPADTMLEEKLRGCLENFRTTMTFIDENGLDI